MASEFRLVLVAAVSALVFALPPCRCDNATPCKGAYTFKSENADPKENQHLNCTLNSSAVVAITFQMEHKQALSYVIQAHTFPTHTLNLAQTSDCPDISECSTNGSNIGLVGNDTADYSLSVVGAEEEEIVWVVLAAVVHDRDSPIPGGCANVCRLAYNAMLQISLTAYSYSTQITFQDSSVGRGMTSDIDLMCSDSYIDSNITYTLYATCVHATDFSETSLMEQVIKFLDLKPSDEKNYHKLVLQHNDPKRVTFDTTRGKGVVYNVVATHGGKTSAYVPAVSFSCDFFEGSCRTLIVDYVFAILLLLVGLFLCFLGHRFFHAEILLMSAVISSYLVFFVFNAATRGDWSHTALLPSVVAIAVVPTLLLFLIWCFTGSYFLFVTLFGVCMGYVIINTLLFTPLVHEWSYFSKSYIYILVILLGMVIAVLPLLVFPRVQNIWCTSVLGSYCVIFALGAVTYSRVPDIVLKPANNAALDGFIKAHFSCQFDIVDFALCSLWAFLISLGIIVQTIITTYEERKFKKKQADEMTQFHKSEYSPFPPAPYKLFKNWRKRRNGTLIEARPLLSPSTSARINYGPHL